MKVFQLKYKTQLLHFLKGSGMKLSKGFLHPIKLDYKNWCPFANHGPLVDENCYALFQQRTGWVDYLRHYVLTIKYLTGNIEYKELEKLVERLAEPTFNKSKKEFEGNLNELMDAIKGIESDIIAPLNELTCLECDRLGEAISCLTENCFTAATVMGASAVESRLHYLIKRRNGKLYKKSFQHSSLGGLIKLFDKHEYQEKQFAHLKGIVPDKHRSLLDLINTYRIFSAHPLGKEIDYRVAETVINLSFLFLLDPELKIVEKKLLKHK